MDPQGPAYKKPAQLFDERTPVPEPTNANPKSVEEYYDEFIRKPNEAASAKVAETDADVIAAADKSEAEEGGKSKK